MDKLIKKLGINEKYTKPIKKPIFDKVRENTYPKANYNYMADLLHLPTTKEGFSYLLVIVDLWSNEFDMEPLKTKEPKEVLEEMLKIFKRKYVKEPKASIRTDNGTEFQGVFHKWLFDHDIFHRFAEPYRHQQLANVEMLNYVFGRFLNGYMNKKEEETGKTYKEWTDILPILRKDLNKLRLKKDGNPYGDIFVPPIESNPKYKVGDLVYRKVEKPINALGHFQNTSNFRVGDYRYDIKNPRKINQILYYPRNIRYILNEFPHVSYAESELMPAKEKQETYTVKAIIDRKTEKGVVKYLVWWNKYKKSESTWETKAQLIEDGVKPMLDAYDSSH